MHIYYRYNKERENIIMMDWAFSKEIYAIGLPIAFLIILFEAGYAAWKKKSLYQKEDTWGSIGLFIGNFIVVSLSHGLILSFYIFLYQFNILNIADYLPDWAVWVVAFLIIDFVFYWYHRFSHRVRFLWAIHMNHHSSTEMNFLVSLRQGWFNPLSKVSFFWIIPVFILDPTIMLTVGAVSTLYGILTHTKLVDKLGILEYILVTPSHHRAHHGSNKEYLDKNYANMFIFYDFLFGTFAKETVKVKYGLTKNINTNNPVKIVFLDWKNLYYDIRNSQSITEAFQYILKPPGWKPSFHSGEELNSNEVNRVEKELTS